MTKRKSPRDAGMPREIASAVAQCHAWLNNNARPPKVVDDLSPEQRSIALEKCRTDPHLLVSMGAAADEDPESRTGLVRTLLAELVVAKQVDEFPDLRRSALEAERAEAVLFDDARTRKALPLLEHGLQGLALLKEESEDRRVALPRLGCEMGDRMTRIGLLHHLESVLRVVIAQSRMAMGADPPRGLAELKTFRAWWSSQLNAGGFSYVEIASLLGYEAEKDQAARIRIRDAVRKNCRRGRERRAGARRPHP